MEPRTIYVDGVSTVIRPMGTDYIVGDDPGEAGVTYAIKCWPGKNIPGVWANPHIVAYFRKIMKAYGTSAITAWQDKTLVGFLPFMPVDCGMPEMVFCVIGSEGEQPILERINSSDPTPFKQLTPKILKVQCASVAWNMNMYRKGLGSAMVRYLIDWAKENGWYKIQGWAFESPEIDDAYRWLPSIQFWEKSGFERRNARVFDPSSPGTNKPGFDFVIDLRK
jgi:hypothetical protein